MKKSESTLRAEIKNYIKKKRQKVKNARFSFRYYLWLSLCNGVREKQRDVIGNARERERGATAALKRKRDGEKAGVTETRSKNQS